MIILDAGALFALEGGEELMWARLKAAHEGGITIGVPALSLAQAWRGGPGALRLALALEDTVEIPFDGSARAVGELCARAGTNDVVTAAVAIVAARPGVAVVYTANPEDVSHLVKLIMPKGPRVIGC